MILEEGQKVKVQATDDQFRNVNLLHKVSNGAVGTVLDNYGHSNSRWRVRFNNDWWEFSEDMLQLVDEDTPITDDKIRGFKVDDVVKIVQLDAELSRHVHIGAVGKITGISEPGIDTRSVRVRFNNDWWPFKAEHLQLVDNDTPITDDKPKVDDAVIPINSETLAAGDRVMFVGSDSSLEYVDISDYNEVRFGAVGVVVENADYFGGTTSVRFNNTKWWLKPDRLIKMPADMPTTSGRASCLLQEPRRMLKSGDVVMFLGTREDLDDMGISSDLANGAVGIVELEDDCDSATYPMVRFNNIAFYIRSKFLHHTSLAQTNDDGTKQNCIYTSDHTAQTQSAYADVTISTFTPTNEVFTMLTLKTIYTLNGDDVEDLSVAQINSRIQREEEEIEAMKKGKAKTKAYQREVAKREANLAEIIAFFDSRDDVEQILAAE